MSKKIKSEKGTCILTLSVRLPQLHHVYCLSITYSSLPYLSIFNSTGKLVLSPSILMPYLYAEIEQIGRSVPLPPRSGINTGQRGRTRVQLPSHVVFTNMRSSTLSRTTKDYNPLR